MAEQITLTVPVVVQTTTAGFSFRSLYLGRDERLVLATFRGDNGETRELRLEGDAAEAAFRQLNTANLSTVSLVRRLMQRAIAEGLFAGAVTGTPDA